MSRKGKSLIEVGTGKTVLGMRNLSEVILQLKIRKCSELHTYKWMHFMVYKLYFIKLVKIISNNLCEGKF